MNNRLHCSFVTQSYPNQTTFFTHISTICSLRLFKDRLQIWNMAVCDHFLLCFLTTVPINHVTYTVAYKKVLNELSHLLHYCLLLSTVTKLSTIYLYLTKLYVINSFAIASSVKYSEIRQNFSNSVCSVWASSGYPVIGLNTSCLIPSPKHDVR